MSATSLAPAFKPAAALPAAVPRRVWLPPSLVRFAVGLVLPVALLVLWQVAAARGWLPPQILPSPAEVWAAGADLWRTGQLGSDVAISLQRVAEGFAVGALAGLTLGTAMGVSRTLEDYVRPLFVAVAQIPSLGWIPLLMMIFGIGEVLKVAVIAKAAFVPMTMNTFAGVRGIPRGYTEVADALRFTAWQRLRFLLLPAAVPPVFTGVRYGLSHAWMALVAVELLASSEGIGYLLVYGRQMFWLDTVVMAMVVIGVIGFVLDFVLGRLERRMQRWRVG